MKIIYTLLTLISKLLLFSSSFVLVSTMDTKNLEISTVALMNATPELKVEDHRGFQNVTLIIDDVQKSKLIEYSILIDVNTSVSVQVYGNPTTGFSQKMTEFPNASIVKPLSSKPKYVSEKHDINILGAGGKFIFDFQAISPGETSAVIDYARYFLKLPESIHRTIINFIVKDQLELETKNTTNNSTNNSLNNETLIYESNKNFSESEADLNLVKTELLKI